MKDITIKEVTIKEVQKGMIELIKKGLIAKVISGKEVFYVNASQVKVKCPHCGKIVNEGKYNPHPKGSRLKDK